MKKIGIGECMVSSSPIVLSTLLGSCVSVCLFSEESKIGGLIHFALPDKSHAQNTQRSDLNFGDLAIAVLLKKILAYPGVKKETLKAKIVGGGNVIQDIQMNSNIGALNVSKAKQVLRELGIPVVGEHVGGDSGRLIYFYTDTGRLRVSLIDKVTNLNQPTVTTAAKKELPIPKSRKKVLIIDDSKTMREILKKIFEGDDLEVVGLAASAREALPLIKGLSPDVITLDIHMPEKNGVEFLEEYLPQYPIPTVMISSLNIHESDLVMRALEIGAVDYLQKPTLEEIKSQSAVMKEKVLIAASIKVKKEKFLTRSQVTSFLDSNIHDRFIAIGASTGGTEAIKEVLLKLPENIPPILIVQHIPPVFSTAFAKRLNELCPFEVIEGRDGDEVKPGRVIVAPGGMQMEVVKRGGRYYTHVFDGERVNRHKPSVDVLFRSVAQVLGSKATGIILTGMGADGAEGLLRMKKAGSFTIAQDESSSVVYGMPKMAKEMGAVDLVCPLQKVSEELIKFLKQHKKSA